MNVYVMFCFIETVGGGQNYVDSKVKYLEQNNWKVIVFSPKTERSEHSPWPNLGKFWDNRCRELGFSPEFWSKKVVGKTIGWMVDIIGKDNGRIIIESHTDYFAEWGEILAEKLNAKHICFLLDERLELYGAKEFLFFKYLRGELAGIHKSSISRLFRDYKEINAIDFPVLSAAHYNTLQDLKNDRIDNLTKRDWNIAYIGRKKQYVANVVAGVMKFAMQHSEKQILFLIMGDIGDIGAIIPDNVSIENLGFMTPIPQSFFQHVDVVIAGAGCASISQSAGALTIVADASTCMSGGLLGYTTMDTLFNSGTAESFDVALENALVKKIWRDMPYNPRSVRSESEIDQLYFDHFRFIEQSDQTKVYFDFNKRRQRNYTSMDYIKYYMSVHTPKLLLFVQRIKRILKTVICNE